MIRTIVTLMCLLSSVVLLASDEKGPSYPIFSYPVARAHAIKPHRRSVPLDGVEIGFHQIQLLLTVSPKGDVVDAKATSTAGDALKFWSQLQAEVRGWKFTPFEDHGKPITAEIVEYLDIVPPERLPKFHVSPPTLRPNSKVTISLQRTGCFGNCPAYAVTVSTEGIVFEGQLYVAAKGRQTDTVRPDQVRKLAKTFIDADFYSMDSSYVSSVTDLPTYVLSISIDGHEKQVKDYVGSWVGMPVVISELEDDVDAFARTERWIK